MGHLIADAVIHCGLNASVDTLVRNFRLHDLCTFIIVGKNVCFRNYSNWTVVF